MEKINALSSLKGRKLLHEIYRELRYEKQHSNLAALGLCWRICVNARELNRYVKKEVEVAHPLGFFAGTSLWMEEIVNRYYFSSINSFVYLGAAVLLVLIGLRRFSDHVDDALVIAGVAFEALMLIFMFIVMMFSPNEDAQALEDDDSAADELLMEIGEIGRDLAAVTVQLENLSSSFNDILGYQQKMVDQVESVSRSAALAVSPNPEMLDAMRSTNEALREFEKTVKTFSLSAKSIKKDEIELAVRKEVERILVEKLAQ